MRTYRVEFFYIGIKFDNRETVDSWEAEEWRYPDLTVTDYMEASDWELSPRERISGIIVTLFVDGYYDPVMDAKDGICDRYTGMYYVDID